MDKKAKAREYYVRNRERIRAQQKERRATAAGRETNKRCSDEWYQRAKGRGVVVWRLKPPRGLEKLAAALRWRTTLKSSNGAPGGSVWEYMMLFGDAKRIRYRDKMADAGSASGPGSKWLRRAEQGR